MKNKGFSLVELLVVITIIGILSGIAGIAYKSWRDRYNVESQMKDDVFKEAGRLKATYKISLADSIAIAETKTRKAGLLTADHHEFDHLDSKGEANFYWIR